MDQRANLTVTTPPFDRLFSKLRHKAEDLRLLGAVDHAKTVEYCVDLFEEVVLSWRNEELTVVEAAAESGYSAAHLRRLLADSRLENAGSQGRPRIRRGDLPRKPNRQSANEVDLVGEVLRARQRHGT